MIAALLGEGRSDRALLPILRWLLGRCADQDIRVEWVDTERFRLPHRTLKEKVAAALIACPCDLLFVHRDADHEDPQPRHEEIRGAVGAHPHVAVVPVRETEAWLLIDPKAIAAAAGRPRWADALNLPPVARLEAVADPKRLLKSALMEALGQTGRRAAHFDPDTAMHRAADLVEDWSPLLQLSAFQRLERDTRAALGASA